MIDNIDDIKLLQKYLIEEYLKKGNNKQAAKKLTDKIMLKYKDNLFGQFGLTYILGKTNFEFFCMYFLGHIFVPTDENNKAPLSTTHFEIWRDIQDTILNKKSTQQKNYICPRGFGKTTTISTPLAIWTHCYEYKRYTVIASAVGDTAEEFLKNIRNAIEGNKKIEQAFGVLIDKKRFTTNSEKIELANKTMIQSISASGAIRGKNYNSTRIELLILDDYQKADEVQTEEARNKKWKIFNEDAKNAMQKNNATMIAVGTVQNKDCFYSRLISSNTWKSKVERGVLIDNVDEYFHEGLWEDFYKLLVNKKDDNSLDTATEFYLQHKDQMQFPTLWNEYWKCIDFALSYYEDRQAFMQEIQNDVNSIGERKFKTIVTESAEEIESHNFKKTILCIDPANTRTKSKKKDYFAFVVCSKKEESKIKYIKKGEIYKFTKNQEYEDYLQHTLILLRKYKDITHLCIEKNTYGGADAIKLQELINEDKELSNRNIEIISFTQSQNKDDKINTIVGAVNLGQIIFNEEDIEGIEQLKEFVSCKISSNDDFVDCTAQACKMIDEIDKEDYSFKIMNIGKILRG